MKGISFHTVCLYFLNAPVCLHVSLGRSEEPLSISTRPVSTALQTAKQVLAKREQNPGETRAQEVRHDHEGRELAVWTADVGDVIGD